MSRFPRMTDVFTRCSRPEGGVSDSTQPSGPVDGTPAVLVNPAGKFELIC